MDDECYQQVPTVDNSCGQMQVSNRKIFSTSEKYLPGASGEDLNVTTESAMPTS